MQELSSFEPILGKTGLFKDPCLVFGNGIELETKIWDKSPSENVFNEDGRIRHHLTKQIGPNARGVDIVKIHFAPKTSLAARATEHELVPPDERQKIRIDAMLGLLSMADYLRKNKNVIQDGQIDQDFYLLADTNPGFALFLRQNCSFRGSAASGQVWIKASEFVTNENIQKMLQVYARYQEDIKRNQRLSMLQNQTQ